jgi:signal transduction histidine kinase/streptogramin lyase
MNATKNMYCTHWYRIIRLLLFSVIVCCLPNKSALAQPSLTTDQVLSKHLIQQIVQDDTGFLWIATDEGVFRYDGYQMVAITALLPVKQWLPSGYYSLAIGHTDELWLLGEAGLFRYSITKGQLTSFPLPHSASGGYSIKYLAVDKKRDRLLIAYNSRELVAMTMSQGKVIPGSYQHFSFDISWLASAADGSLWIVAIDHRIIHLLADGRQQYYQGSSGKFLFPIPDTQPQQFVSACAQYAARPTGHLYEVSRWLPETNSHLSEWNFFHPQWQSGNMHWVAGEYLVRLRQQPRTNRVIGSTVEAMHFENSQRYDSPIAYYIFRSRLNNEFIFSSSLRGCYKRTATPTIERLLVAKKKWYSTRAILRLPDQRLLVSSYLETLVQPACHPAAPLKPWLVWEMDDIVTTVFHSLLPLTATQLIGADDSGFHLINSNTQRRRRLGLSATTSLQLPGIFVVQGNDGRIWAGAKTGLFWLDTTHLWLHPYHNARLGQALQTMQALVADRDGALWLATTTGLYHLNPSTGAVQRFAVGCPKITALPTNELLSLHVVGNQVWVGTRDQGLLLVDPRWGVVRQLTVTDGLPSNTVCSLLTDQQRNLWLGTYAGIVRYNPSTSDLTVFTAADGLADEECNYQSAFRDTDGSLYFGSVKGVTHIWPQRLVKRYSPYRRLVVSQIVHSAGQDATTHITYPSPITHDTLQIATDDIVEVQVALTESIRSETTQYWYQLRGLTDTTWHRTSSVHTVQLANLQKGNYILVVKARAGSGIWAANRLMIPVQVSQTWWKCPVTWGAGGLLVVKGIAVYGWCIRRRHRKQQQQLRGQLAHDLHDELGALLVRASLQAELLKSEHQANIDMANSLLQNLQAASQAMRDVVWGIDPHNDRLGNLLDRIDEYLEQTATLANLRVKFYHQDIDEAQFMSGELRQHIYYIFKEAVTNSLRHAYNSTTLTVSVLQQADLLLMHVQDDGQATVRTKRQGTGLRSMVRRANALGGKLEASAQPEGGFKVTLTVPLAVVRVS